MTNVELEAASNAAQAAADAAQVDATQALVETAALRAPSFVVLGPSATLSNERVLTQGTNIQLQDGGAGGNVTIILAVGDLTGINKAMTIRPAAPSGVEDAGVLTLSGQAASGSIYNGGNVSVSGGNGGASAVGGDVLMAGGSGDSGGGVSQTGGVGSTFGGNVSIIGGESTGVGGFAGGVSITGGLGAGASATGGDVNISPGNGSAANGTVLIKGANGFYAIQATDDATGALIGLHGAAPVAQSTGWGSPTGTATKTAFNTATVTTAQLAERVKALLDYLIARGDIGP